MLRRASTPRDCRRVGGWHFGAERRLPLELIVRLVILTIDGIVIKMHAHLFTDYCNVLQMHIAAVKFIKKKRIKKNNLTLYK